MTGGKDEAPVIVAVSPHLDDAAFSAGGFLAGAMARGARVRVITVFTATVADPQGFALACQTDKGYSPDVDYMAMRRAEDESAMAALGAEWVHLGLPEAPHRGYHSAPALFGPVVTGDEAVPELVAGVLERELTRDGTPDLVLGPRALGDHVDHRHVRDALEIAAARHGLRTVQWDDLPYALRLEPGAGGAHECPADAVDMAAKLDACAAYPSQLGFQFGDVAAMRSALRDRAEIFDADPRALLLRR